MLKKTLIQSDSINDVDNIYRHMMKRRIRELDEEEDRSKEEVSKKEEIDMELDSLWEAAMEQILAQVLAELDFEAVLRYISKENNDENLLALGKIFEVLGRYASVLIGNINFGTLIANYLMQFTGKEMLAPFAELKYA